MHRLFVAIRPPAPVRERLLAAMRGGSIAGARWQDDDQLHLTLRFIGEVERPCAEDIAAALGGVHAPAMDLVAGQIGRFEHKGRTDALWVGVGPAEPLARLHNKIDRALVGVGLTPERRAFKPHITLARFARGASAPPVLPTVSAPAFPPFRAEHVCLYESHLSGAGARYEIVARYPLDAPAAASNRSTSGR